jgi:hypothetical protein
MKRWVWFLVCAFLGLVMLGLGLAIPAHLRAVDARVLEKAGKKTPALVEQGLRLTSEKKLGAAQLVLRAADEETVAGREQLRVAVTNLATEHPGFLIWGGSEPHLEILFETESRKPRPTPEPFTDFIVRLENRSRVIALLQASSRPIVLELLHCRDLTNTVLFPPSVSASGQALDAAVSVCGLLLDESHISPALSNAIYHLAIDANYAHNSQPLEQLLLDLMSLAQRLNWGQLVEFIGPVQDVETVRLQANLVRRAGNDVPILFSSVELTGNPRGIAEYLMNFSQTGLKDIAGSLRYGAGGVNELLQRNQRLYIPPYTGQIAAQLGLADFSNWALDYCWHKPWFARILKWILFLVGGFLLAAALHCIRPAALELPSYVRGFHIAREVLFALGFLVVVLLLSEPFLSQESQKMEFPFRLRLPTAGQAVPAAIASAKATFMDQKSLLTLLLFFVLQGLIYTACVVKLAEIRRQRVMPRIKLRLLENEEHLFDAGLYVGFAGTIISLILVSMNVIKPSLMAAYGSTSFGIIFVSIFKIFHLRPARRRLLLESEAASPESIAPVGARTVATPP